MAEEEKPVEKPVEKTLEEKPKDPPKASEEKPKDPPKAAKGDDDDLVPDDDGVYKIPQAQFLKRVAQMSAKELRRIFGTSDLDKIAEERKEAQSLKKAKEAADAKADEERRAKLDEETRLKEDLKKKEDRIAELERLNSEKEEGMLADRQEQVLTKIAAKLFEEDYVDVALDRFRRHVRGLSSSKVRAMDEEDVSTWFRQYAEKHPKIARGADSTETDDDKKKRETAEAAKKPKVPLDTKPKDRKTATSSLDMGKFGGKTPRPGQPNSMNSTELAEYKRARGMSW